MIKYFDSIDLAFAGKSFVKKDLFYALIKKEKIDLKKYYFIGIDDKLGVLKIINDLKSKKIKAKSFWINRGNWKKYPKKYYDYEIKSLHEINDFIKKRKIKNAFIIADFDNTLAKANYEAVKRSLKESSLWERLPKNPFVSLISMILAPFTYFTIIIDFFKPSNTPFKDSKKFKNFILKNNITCWVMSYRNKVLQKKYF